jgi:hypothetical protein
MRIHREVANARPALTGTRRRVEIILRTTAIVAGGVPGDL